MKICRNCFQEFEDDPYSEPPNSPAEALGEIFLAGVGDDNRGGGAQSLCPACRENLGMLGMLGFDL